MSVYDELSSCIEIAWSNDSCDYDVYSEMFDLIAEAEAESDKLKQLVRDMWDVALHPETFGDGSHLLKRMHDLGVEVEE